MLQRGPGGRRKPRSRLAVHPSTRPPAVYRMGGLPVGGFAPAGFAAESGAGFVTPAVIGDLVAGAASIGGFAAAASAVGALSSDFDTSLACAMWLWSAVDVASRSFFRSSSLAAALPALIAASAA